MGEIWFWMGIYCNYGVISKDNYAEYLKNDENIYFFLILRLQIKKRQSFMVYDHNFQNK